MTKRAIDLEEFKKLSLKQQMEILHKEGVFVGKQLINEKSVILYQLNHFYAEVHYKDYRKNVESIVISEDMDMLRPYLSQIRVRDLDKNYD